MTKKRFFDLLYVIMIISLIIFMVWIVSFMRSSAKQCLSNPISYFEAKNDGAVCSCIKDGVIYPNRSFYKVVAEKDTPEINLSLLDGLKK